MKIAVNRCYGGFSLSHEAQMLYAAKKGITIYPYIHNYGDVYKEYDGVGNTFSLHYTTKKLDLTKSDKAVQDELNANYYSGYDIERNDPLLIEVIQELGSKANGSCADIEIVEIPDDINYEINDYDGMESIHEKHRSW